MPQTGFGPGGDQRTGPPAPSKVNVDTPGGSVEVEGQSHEIPGAGVDGYRGAQARAESLQRQANERARRALVRSRVNGKDVKDTNAYQSAMSGSEDFQQFMDAALQGAFGLDPNGAGIEEDAERLQQSIQQHQEKSQYLDERAERMADAARERGEEHTGFGPGPSDKYAFDPPPEEPPGTDVEPPGRGNPADLAAAFTGYSAAGTEGGQMNAEGVEANYSGPRNKRPAGQPTGKDGEQKPLGQGRLQNRYNRRTAIPTDAYFV